MVKNFPIKETVGDFSGRPSKTAWSDARGWIRYQPILAGFSCLIFCLLVVSLSVFFFFLMNTSTAIRESLPQRLKAVPQHQRAWSHLLLIQMWAQVVTQFFSLQLLLRICDNRREQWYKTRGDALNHWWLNPRCSSLYEKESVLVA